MDEWMENSQDINVFSDYDCLAESKDAVKRKRVETNVNFSIQNAAIDKSVETENDQVKNKEFCRGDGLPKRVKESETPAGLEDENSVWSIEDDTFFYPLGICNHCIAGANKSVIIIWSEYSVINFVIKKMINKRQTKTTRVRLNVRNDETIKDVKILEFNTLLLLENGHINYFSSVKSMHSLPWLEGVRCIGKTLHGFCIIRLAADQKLLLEVYDDAVDMGKKIEGSVKQQYDITFDEQNLFNCDWKDDKFIIFAVAIDVENIEFMEHITAHSCDFKDQSEIFIFAVSGNIFVLIPDADNNEIPQIEMIFAYASNIAFIKIDYERKFCLIFLECGTVDIWYMSTITKRLLHQIHNTGAAYVNFAYSDSRASFFFTDESQVVEMRFSYNAISDKLSVIETYKAIPGILACTWIETIEQLICLDCNNIFHQLSFEAESSENECDDNEYKYKREKLVPSTSEANYEKFNTIFELTSNRVTQLIEKSNVLQQLKSLPKKLYEAIENEYLKQQLLAVDDKQNFYAKQLTAHLKFSKQHFLEFEKNTLLLHANTHDFLSDDNNLLAHIRFEIACKNIFRNSIAQLHVYTDNSLHIFSLPHNLLESKIHLVVPLKRHAQRLITDIQLYLYTFISHTTDHVALSLPIRLIETTETYIELFSRSCNNFEKMNNFYNLNNLLLRFKNEVAKDDSLDFQHFLSLPKNTSFDNIIKLFKFMSDEQPKATDNTCEIAFLRNCISMSWNKLKGIMHLKSNDAVALYYFKLYLTLAHNEKQLSNGIYEFHDYQQMLMRHQCNVERFYGKFAESKDYDTISFMNQRREELNRIYEKIRKYLISK